MPDMSWDDRQMQGAEWLAHVLNNPREIAGATAEVHFDNFDDPFVVLSWRVRPHAWERQEASEVYLSLRVTRILTVSAPDAVNEVSDEVGPPPKADDDEIVPPEADSREPDTGAADDPTTATLPTRSHKRAGTRHRRSHAPADDDSRDPTECESRGLASSSRSASWERAPDAQRRRR